MRTEEECESFEKYLFSNMLLSDEEIVRVKEGVFKRSKDETKDLYYERFVNWRRKKNEVVIFTLYAYADFELPKEFNCILNLDNPNEYVKSEFILTQSIYEGFYPIGNIEDGHKHICVIEFKDEIPNILEKLFVVKNRNYDVPKNSVRLGICNFKDFPAIKKRQEHTILLRKKYGSEYWKHIKTE